MLLMLGAFIATFSATKSLGVAGFAAGMVFAAGLGIVFFIGMLKAERLRLSGIAEVDKMDGHKFEHYLGHLFRSQGYHAEVTQAAGDFGVDLLLKKQGKKIAVQAKRYKGNVGLEAVQQVQAGKAHYGASEAWVVTNNDYTDQAYTLAKSNGVRLIARNELIELMLKIKTPKKPASSSKGATAKQTAALSSKQDSICDVCGGTI
ncbi:restriction endonuclease [Paenibacillus sp. sptzw28]|uniref:restriction endonuclease n=1 Tax=Paenibacillus sp. sptzw28 TaxID=715179 RepID=UPI0021639AF0|nr:restriction endonuclease [Paenibacillus sp. sptzw28]